MHLSFELIVTEMTKEGSHSRYEAACSLVGMVDPYHTNASAAGFHEEPCFQSDDGYYFSWYPWYTGPSAWLLTITKCAHFP